MAEATNSVHLAKLRASMGLATRVLALQAATTPPNASSRLKARRLRICPAAIYGPWRKPISKTIAKPFSPRLRLSLNAGGWRGSFTDAQTGKA